MKGFNRWMNRMQNVAPLYRAVERLGLLKPVAHPGGLIGMPGMAGIGKCFEESSTPEGYTYDQWIGFIRMAIIRAPSRAILETWAIGGLVTQGVRVYCPTVDECNALSQIELNVPWSAYRQPYDTFVVVLPDGFYDRPVRSDGSYPVACICRLDAEACVAAFIVCCADNEKESHSFTGQYVWADNPNVDIEDHWAGLLDVPSELTDTEDEARERIKRIAINACLALTHYGCREIGSANPEYAARLEANLHKKRLPESVARANRAALEAIPTVYGFDQHVKVFDRDGPATGGSGTHDGPKPHWRRGHWAHQAHGPGFSERKLIFRRPVMVNAVRFAGDEAATRVTLTTANGGKR